MQDLTGFTWILSTLTNTMNDSSGDSPPCGMKKISIQYLQTSLGELVLGSLEDKLCLCDWRFRKQRNTIDNRIKKVLGAYFTQEPSAVIRNASDQLREYLNGRRKVFGIPLQMAGTPFQKRVWEELLQIPYGKTRTYAWLARQLADDKSIRAVAAANGANALAIFIPCHRIIGSRGEMVGYAGGLTAKRKLLTLESGDRYPEQISLFDTLQSGSAEFIQINPSGREQ